MNIDRRLHHAARELREVHVEPPPLVVGASGDRRAVPHRRIPALVAPVLFALGGLVVVAGGLRAEPTPDEPSLPTPTTIADAGPTERTAGGADTVTATVATTAGQEMQIIADLVARTEPASATAADAAPIVPPGPIGVV